MAKTLNRQLSASAAVTADGNSSAVDVSEYRDCLFLVDVTAVTGTSPTLDITVQTLDAENNVWVDHTAFDAQITTTGDYKKSISAPVGSRVRLKYDVGGTSPSFTLSSCVIASDY